jgi:hypothetical protein
MKTFVGRIVTVPDGAGRSVTVSNWGVAQSSRHREELGLSGHLVESFPHKMSYTTTSDAASASVVYATTEKLSYCIRLL